MTIDGAGGGACTKMVPAHSVAENKQAGRNCCPHKNSSPKNMAHGLTRQPPKQKRSGRRILHQEKNDVARHVYTKKTRRQKQIVHGLTDQQLEWKKNTSGEK